MLTAERPRAKTVLRRNIVPTFFKREETSEITKRPERRRTQRREWVFPEHLNTLTQPRNEFTNIEELATSIAFEGPISEIIVAFFDNEIDCQKYIDDLNASWKKDHTMRELKPTVLENGTPGVLIVIAGERRTHANMLLKTKGCLACQEEYGEATCFDRHFPDNEGRIEVKVKTNPSYHKEAVPVQEDENFHINVSPGRMALSIHNRWTSLRITNPDITTADFARKIVHKSPDTVRKALRYVEGMPDIIKTWVNSGKLKYGHALELLRMREVGYHDFDLMNAALPALDSRNKMSLGPFRKRVDGFVNAKVQQLDMLELFRDIQQSAQEKRNRLSTTIAADTRVDLIAAAQRLGIHHDLIAYGYVSAKDSALIRRSGTEALDKLAGQLESVPRQLDTALRRSTRERIKRVAPAIQKRAGKLLDLIGEDAIA